MLNTLSEPVKTDPPFLTALDGTLIELSDGNDRFPPRPNTLHAFVGDVDDCYRRALEAGATSLYELADMPYGERSGGVEDPFGNHWYIATFKGEKVVVTTNEVRNWALSLPETEEGS